MLNVEFASFSPSESVSVHMSGVRGQAGTRLTGRLGSRSRLTARRNWLTGALLILKIGWLVKFNITL